MARTCACVHAGATIVGGIYTVIRTKAPTIVHELGDHYCLIGPYMQELAQTEFESIEVRRPRLRAWRRRQLGAHSLVHLC